MDGIGRGSSASRNPADGLLPGASGPPSPSAGAPGGILEGALARSGMLRSPDRAREAPPSDSGAHFASEETVDLSASSRTTPASAQARLQTPSEPVDERPPGVGEHSAQPALGLAGEGGESMVDRMRGRAHPLSDRNLGNLILMESGESPDLLCRVAVEDGAVTTLFEGVLNRAHRADDARKKEAARFILLMLKAHGEYVYEHCTRLVDLALSLSRHLGVQDETTDREVQDGLIYRNAGEVAFYLTKQSPRQRYALAAFLAGIEVAQESLLHDIGKIQVPAEVLFKPGPLDEKEKLIMQQHPVWGAEILSQIPPLRHAIPVVRHHHERWDGTGYPDQLRGEGIPMAARIVSVVDAFDAMISDRPYRKGIPVDDALREIAQGAGLQFDPRVASGFLSIVHGVWNQDEQY